MGKYSLIQTFTFFFLYDRNKHLLCDLTYTVNYFG